MKKVGYKNNSTYLWGMKLCSLVLIIFFIGCAKDTVMRPSVDVPVDNTFKRANIYCLRDYIINEDAGGVWTQVGTTPQNIGGLLVGDNPCIQWSALACGQYTLKYKVGAACCQDSVIITPIKCCLVGSSTCN